MSKALETPYTKTERNQRRSRLALPSERRRRGQPRPARVKFPLYRRTVNKLLGGIVMVKPESTEEMSVAAWLRGKKVLL